MNSNRYLLQTAAVCAIAMCCTFANATPIEASSTGLANPDVTISFDEVTVTNNDKVTAQYAGKGVTFDPGLYYTPYDQDLGYYTGVIDGNFLGNYTDSSHGPVVASINLMFATTQVRAAFGLAANDGPFLFEAYLGSVLVESFGAADVSYGYYGFTGTSGFDRIVITSLPDDVNFFDVDNIQFDATPAASTDAPNPAVVPEPGVGALLGLGLLGAAASRRRSRKAA